MKKLQKWPSCALAGCLLAALVACSTGGTSLQGASSAADGTSPVSTGEEIEISLLSIWAGADSKAAVFGDMVADFNEEYTGRYHIAVEEQTDYNAYVDKIRTLVSAGTPPDLFTVQDYPDIELFASSGRMMDLTDFISESSMLERFVPGAPDDVAVENRYYALPYETAIIPMIYNTRLLAEAGVTDLPTSFEELLDLCEVLQSNGVYATSQMSGKDAWMSMLFYSYAVAACGGPDVYERGLADPAFVEAAELMLRLYEYTSPDAIGADATVANAHFFNERTAVYSNGTWILGRIRNEGVEGLYENIAVAPGLSYNGQNGGAYLNKVQASFMAAAQEDPAKEEGVQAFLRYITAPDRIAALSESSGSVFAIKMDESVITDPVLAEIIRQNNEASFHVGHFQGAVPTTVASAFPMTLEGLILGELTPEEFVQELIKTTE